MARLNHGIHPISDESDKVFGSFQILYLVLFYTDGFLQWLNLPFG
jgi:hypothetical protein